MSRAIWATLGILGALGLAYGLSLVIYAVLFFHILANFDCADEKTIGDARRCLWLVRERDGGEDEIARYTGSTGWVDWHREREPELRVVEISTVRLLGMSFYMLVAPDGRILGAIDTYE